MKLKLWRGEREGVENVLLDGMGIYWKMPTGFAVVLKGLSYEIDFENVDEN